MKTFTFFLTALLWGVGWLHALEPNTGDAGQRRAGAAMTAGRTLSDRSRIVNSSVRARVGEGEKTLIAGFVIAGEGKKRVLIRGVGPALSALGVMGALPTPVLDLHDLGAARIIGSARGWAGADANEIEGASKTVGAFPLPGGSDDAALLRSLKGGVYTANVRGAGSTGGVALLEVYDAESDAASKIVNLSARTVVGTGENILILGLVISGPDTKQVLVRGVGPGLLAQGVVDALKDPRLELRNGAGEVLMSNDDWSDSAPVADAGALVGAFPLAAGSKDAAFLAALAPGVYTVQVTGVSATTGVAMVELYDVPLTSPATRWTMVNVSPNGQQADCHVIEFPDGRVALMDIADAGDAGGAALAYLRARKIETIDLVVLSHFHRDHYGRLSDVIDAGIKVRRVAYNLPSPNAAGVNAEVPWGFSRPEAEWLLQKLASRGIATFTPYAGQRLIEVLLRDGSMASLEAVCLYDGVSSPVGLTDTNDTSIIVRLVHGKTRALFTGDLNASLGTWLATSSFDLSADLLKVPHHGTEGCAPDSFFERVNAKVALVPSPAGLWASPRSARIRDYFTRRGIPVYVSGLDGHVTVTMDAGGYSVERQ